MELTRTERLLLEGIQARDREAMTNIILPLRADTKEVLSMIEERLGLPEGSIGTTHGVDDQHQVVPKPEE